MEMLAEEELERVFLHLPLVDMVRSLAVCKHWNHLLSSQGFLHHYHSSSPETWLTVIHDARALNFYGRNFRESIKLDLSFLPPEYTIPLAASQGLMLVFSQLFMNLLCLCNPLTKAYKILPRLDALLSNPITFILEKKTLDSHKVLVISDDFQALYSPEENRWIDLGGVSGFRLRSGVITSDGLIYGIEVVGSDWNPSWRLVFSEIDNSGIIWKPVEHNWGDISDIVKGPCLIRRRGREDCLLMAGGLKVSLSLNSACYTFVVLELDLNTYEWSEATRMPNEFFQHFDPYGEFSIFCGRDGVYFCSRKVTGFVMWDFSAKGSWRWVENCGRDGTIGLWRGFAFEPRLDALP